MKLRSVPADENNQMRGGTLEKMIRKDIADGLIPFYIVATLGTTNSCAFDRLDEIGVVGNDYDVWVHVDAAYAGSAFICPEFQPLMKVRYYYVVSNGKTVQDFKTFFSPIFLPGYRARKLLQFQST